MAGAGAWSAVWSFFTGPVAVLPGAAALAASFKEKAGVLTYSLQRPGKVQILLCNLLGREALVINRYEPAGTYSLSFRNRNLAPGAYILQFTAPGIEKRRVVMVKSE